MRGAPSPSMRPVLALLLAGLLLASVPASADFEEVTAGSGLESIDSGPLTNWAAYGPGVAWGDYDQDGDLDVFLTARFDHLGQETAELLNYTHLSEIDFNDLVATEKLLIGSLAYQRDDLEDVLELIANNSVKTSELISKKIGLDDVIDKGFSEMMKTDKDVFRIIVTPSLPTDIN